MKLFQSETHKSIIILLILVFFVQAVWHANTKSPTYDECDHIICGVIGWKTGSLKTDIEHPPFIRFLITFPLLFTKAEIPNQMPIPIDDNSKNISSRPMAGFFMLGTQFLYLNPVSCHTLLLLPRLVNIIIACVLLFIIWLWASELYGFWAGFFSTLITAFCPNIIAYSSLATTDIGGVTTGVLALYALYKSMQKNSALLTIISGLTLGLALLSKSSNIFLIPIFIFLILVYPGKKLLQLDFKGRFYKLFKILLLCWLVLCAGYKFDSIFTKHTLKPEDWEVIGSGKIGQVVYQYAPLPECYLRGLAYVAHHSSIKRGHATFLLGEYSNTGWWYYFPIAFFLKTPSITLIAIFVSFFIIIFKKRKLRYGEFLLIFPAFLFLGSAMISHLNIGLRHIMFIYPLLYIFCGRILEGNTDNLKKNSEKIVKTKQLLNETIFSGLTNTKKYILLITIILLPLETLSISPHYLAFFNRIVGGPKAGINYLSDSNLDWGQDLTGLSKFLNQQTDSQGNRPEVIMSYFGTGVPEYYGIIYQSLPSVWSYPKSMHINSSNPNREFLVISATNLQGTYFQQHNLFEWLKNRKPLKIIGYSIYVYDITNDLESNWRLAEIYKSSGEKEKEIRQLKIMNKLISLKNYR